MSTHVGDCRCIWRSRLARRGEGGRPFAGLVNERIITDPDCPMHHQKVVKVA